MDAREAAILECLERRVSGLLKIRSDSPKPLDDPHQLVRRIRRQYRIRDALIHGQTVFVKEPEDVFVGKEGFVKGDNLYQKIFSGYELSKLNDFVNELRVSGRNGKLSGETFCSYNERTSMKREFIQFGVPIFGQIKVDETNQFPTRSIEPIPALLRGLIEQVIQKQWIPENKSPNGCRIDFFDEGAYSHPFVKPPHLEHPISTFVLSESELAFGDTLPSDGQGNYYKYVGVPIDEGSLFVMNGNSLDATMHAMCASPKKKITITFFKVLG